ncbi:MAG: alpha/beta fold hydrolase [Chloroflexi bacterium]|nr:alpha/beta fold hydrolase [Chloroflexota bacterium]
MDSYHYFYSDGLKLAATLHRPDQPDSQLRPGIVLCQGINGIKEKYRFPEFYARSFVEAGFVALCPEYRGFGDAEGIPGRVNPMERVVDTRNAITFLQQQPGVDPKRIGLWAISYGGATAVFTAAIDPRVLAVVSVNGVSNGERWLKGLRRQHEWLEYLERLREARVRRVMTGETEMIDPSEELMTGSPALYRGRERMLDAAPPENRWQLSRQTLDSAEAILEFRPEEVAPSISPRGLMIVHGDQDTVVPVDEAISLYEKALEPKKLIIVPGRGHHDIYLGDVADMLVHESIAWFAEHLIRNVPSADAIRAVQRSLPFVGMR